MSVTAYVALGSNLGERADYLRKAQQALANLPEVQLLRTSSIYETAPVGGPAGQGAYLNAVAEVGTTLAADGLLSLLLQVEAELGRVRNEKDGPRTLDLDLLLFGDLVCEEEHLTVPHPRMHQRLFVLRPLSELAPGLVHPILRRTVGELLADVQGLRPYGPTPGRELAGLRALVTGSTSGIGRAIALELASAGARVLVHGRRSRSDAEVVAREAQLRTQWVTIPGSLTGSEPRAGVLLADLSDPDACVGLASRAWDFWGGLDVVVNNAGVDTLTGEASAWSFERKLQALLAVDVTATMLLARALGQRMKEQGNGVILNMGWDQAETGMEGDSGELFAATKGAVMAFSKSLALSLAPQVRVHCLAPGWIQTAWGNQASGDWQDRVLRETPLARWGQPEDVARTVRWLASPGANFLSGQVIRINGGVVR